MCNLGRKNSASFETKSTSGNFILLQRPKRRWQKRLPLPDHAASCCLHLTKFSIVIIKSNAVCWIGLTGEETIFASMAQWTVQGLGDFIDYFQWIKCFVLNACLFSGLKAIYFHTQWVLASNFKVNKNSLCLHHGYVNQYKKYRHIICTPLPPKKKFGA